VRCPGCRCVFCPDDADRRFLGAPRRTFCDPSCRRRSDRRRRNRLQAARRRAAAGNRYFANSLAACARRGKPAYPDKASAAGAAGTINVSRKPAEWRTWKPYRCPCGRYHLTTKGSRKPAAAPATED
jgi:hypothetical protein